MIDYNRSLKTYLHSEIGPVEEYNSNLVKKTNAILEKNLSDLSTEDIRLLISQNILLDLLMPLAFEKLEINILSEGDYYPGDLLNSVLKSDNSFWKENKELYLKLCNMIKQNHELLKKNEIDYKDFLNIT